MQRRRERATRSVLKAVEDECNTDDCRCCGSRTAPRPFFLAAIERFCIKQGWILDYDSVADESCAIFYQALASQDDRVVR